MMHVNATEGESTLARPRLPDGELLDRTMTVRATSADLDRLEAAAAALGIKPMTVVRLALLRALDRIEAEGPAGLFGATKAKATRASKVKRTAGRKAGRKA